MTDEEAAPESTDAEQAERPRSRTKLVTLAIVAVVAALAIVLAAQTGLWHVISPPPRYDIPATVTGSDEQRAIQVAQDEVRKVKGRFVTLNRTTLFKNHLGQYRVRGAVQNPFSEPSTTVYQAIVDPESFACLEFHVD